MCKLLSGLAEWLRARGQTFATATKNMYDRYRQTDLILDTSGDRAASVMVPIN